jgi:hypothetical protein
MKLKARKALTRREIAVVRRSRAPESNEGTHENIAIANPSKHSYCLRRATIPRENDESRNDPALAELTLKVIYEGEEPLPLGSPPRTFR